MEVIGLALAAPIVTKIVDTLRNAFDKNGTMPKVVWNIAAFAVGILGAFLFAIEPAGLPAGLRFDLTGAALQIYTGLVLGGLAGGWHEIFHMWSAKAHAPVPSGFTPR